MYMRTNTLWLRWMMLLSSAFLAACTLRIGPYEGDGIAQEDGLPEPDEWTVPPPALTPEQAARQAEVDAYIQEMYKDYAIIATKQSPSGDLVDWVDSSAFELPYTLPISPFPVEDWVLPAGIELPQSELDLFPELLGPQNTTPLLRPDYSGYVMGNTGATSLQDYLDNHQVFGLPAGQDRLYAGVNLMQDNHGIMGIINHFAGEVEDNTFSLVEIAVACPADGPVEELIGVAISIDRVNFKGLLSGEFELEPRVHVEMARVENGVLKGYWDTQGNMFVKSKLEDWPPEIPLPPRTVLGGHVTVSEIDGPQREHLIQIFQVPTGDWWIGYRGEIMGHFPADRFSLLNAGACRAHAYAEVYNGRSGGWTRTDMGSGEFAAAGANKADYFRRIVLLDSYWSMVEVDDKMGTPSQPNVKECYTRTETKNGGPFVGFLFFCGGPGAKSPLCKYPNTP